jgi:hypothetical protein
MLLWPMLLHWDSVIVSWWNFEARFNEFSSRWDDMFDDGCKYKMTQGGLLDV